MKEDFLSLNINRKYLKMIYGAAAFLYLISPWDILPDFLGLPGRLDDLAVIIYVYWKYFRKGSGGEPAGKTRGRDAGGDIPENSQDPHAILGVPKGAPLEEVEAAYREKMMKYHPDKVQHLGAELKKLAEEKSREINEAYSTLKDSLAGEQN